MVVRSRSRSGSSRRRRCRRRTTTIVPSPRAPYCHKKPRLPLQKTPSMRYRRKKPLLPPQKTPTNACHLSIPRKKPSPHRRKKKPCRQYCHRKPFLRSPSQKNPLTPHRCKKPPKLSQKNRSPSGAKLACIWFSFSRVDQDISTNDPNEPQALILKPPKATIKLIDVRRIPRISGHVAS